MKNNNTNKPTGGGFFSGFMWGFVLGAALALLFATKKGRKILKIINEEGASEFEELLDAIRDEAEDPISRTLEKEEPAPFQSSSPTSSVSKTPVKRFFKGTPKRVATRLVN